MSESTRYARTKALFLEALEVDEAERERWLARACAGDEELLAEVQGLLAFSAAGEETVAATPRQPGATPPTTKPPREDRARDLLARLENWERFTDLELIGEGGMGWVFKARDPRLKRDVALKFLHRPAPALHDRFQREAELQARVDHPNVLDIYENGEVAGFLYIAMRLVNGTTLTEIPAQLTLTEQVEIMRQIAEGVDAAHRLGLIHRDLKPGNILVEPSRRGWQPFVTDFGIAVEASETELTETSAFLGSPRYMAPEQLEGTHAVLDERTDVYGLGATFYEFLAGRPAFAESALVDLLIQVRTASPVALSNASSEVPPRLSAIVMRCLEKEPENRFGSAWALADALADLGESTTRLAGAGSGRARWRRGRSLLAASAVGAALLAGWLLWPAPEPEPPTARPAAVAEEGLDLPETAIDRPSVAVVELENSSGRDDADWLSTALAELLTTELTRSSELRLLPVETITPFALHAASRSDQPLPPGRLTALRQLLGVDVLIRGSFRSSGPTEAGPLEVVLHVEPVEGEPATEIREEGSRRDLRELVARLGHRLREALGAAPLDARSSELQQEPPAMGLDARRSYAEGLSRLRRHDILGARVSLEEALRAAPEHPLVESALSRAYELLGRDHDALTAAERAFTGAAPLPQIDRLEIEGRLRELEGDWAKATDIHLTLWRLRPDEVGHALSLASAQVANGKPKAALLTLDRAASLPGTAPEDPRLPLARARANAALSAWPESIRAASQAHALAAANDAPHLMAEALLVQSLAMRRLGDLEPASQQANEARAVFSAIGNRQGVASALTSAGASLRLLGHYDEAIESYDEALAISRQIGWRRGAATALNNVAGIYRERGDLAAAEANYEEALVINREINDRRAGALVISNLGLIRQFDGDLGQALERYRSALDEFRAMDDAYGEAVQHSRIAGILRRQGKLDEAATEAEAALGLFRERGTRAPVASVLNSLGSIERRRGNLPEASRHLDEALALYREMGNRRGEATSFLERAEIEIARGALDAAHELLSAATDTARELGLPRWSGDAHHGLARVALLRGDLATARLGAQRALDSYREARSAERTTAVEVTLARIALADGEHEAAAYRAVRAASADREKERAPGVVGAELVVAKAHLEAGQPELAAQAVTRARAADASPEELAIRLELEVVLSRLELATGEGIDERRIRDDLEAVVRRANVAGFEVTALEARLALAGLEHRLGRTANARAQIARIERIADTRGLVLYQRRAEAMTESF